MTSSSRTLLAVALALPAAWALAEPAAKPPIAQFWMDAATINLSGPGMGGELEGMGIGGLLVGSPFGTARAGLGQPGKWLDSALYTRNKPAGTEGSHTIPPALKMGSSLPLLPVERKPADKGEPGEPGDMERPKGKLLFYWGCGEKVRPGQPRVIDFAKADPAEWGRFMTGRFAPDRGARAVPGRSIWPNERDHQRVPKDASLLGSHEVSGEGVPAGLHFALQGLNDFMPRVQLTASGDPKGSVATHWQTMPSAQGYFLTAMGACGEQELIIWSSSEQPDPGWGLMDYLAPARVKQLIGEKVVLPPTREQCALPAGIFAGAEGAMLRMIAYGPEANFAHPPRPANPKAAWEPEWAARVRIKSTGMTLIGMEQGNDRQSGAPAEGGLPGLGDLNPGNVLKGIFGR
jgi:hypothetical protein